LARRSGVVIGCAALLVPVLGGKEGGLIASPRPLHYGVSPCLHTRRFPSKVNM
jgi:hypothetical protein